ncbi:MAG: DNA-processing protein DprA [Clostridia bacterium]|nr:DNA-processing protein DprA [Clostridia bacterium]
MEDLKYWIWFSRIENLSPKKLLELLEKFNEPKVIFNKTKQDLIKYGINQKDAEKITKPEYKNNLDKYLKYMQENKIQTITIRDKYYPEKLKQIYDPPVVLYLKGNKKILNDTFIAIVGCRLCTSYGKEVSQKIAYNLSLNNINVISGLAKGIDTYSHIGTLKGKAKTLGVMGCGLDRVYPQENRNLFEEIIKNGGAVISEYVIGTKPVARNFPRRNRIISGMSDGVLVVEAKEKSGTLITVDFAQEQGKEIYVVPGNINNPNSYGTNKLIKQGAKVVTCVEDVLEDFQFI